MVENERGLVPINQVQTEKVRIHLPFPSWIEADLIGVDYKRLRRMMNIGGISHLHIVADTNGQVTRAVPIIVGYGPDGNLLGGMGRAIERAPGVGLLIRHSEKL